MHTHDENTMTENEMFNAAINFALDEAEGEGLTFLRMWREGDWNGIANDFPEFDLNCAPR